MEYGLEHNEQQSLDVFSYAVLILVLMEYSLGLHRMCANTNRGIFILVLMEDGLGWMERTKQCVLSRTRLNPCSNGIWSRTGARNAEHVQD